MPSALGDTLLDPRDIEKHAAMGTSAARLHFAVDAASHVIARQQFRRATGVLISLTVTPSFFFGICGLVLVQLRNIVEHETAALLVAEDAAFAANAFGHQNAGDAD